MNQIEISDICRCCLSEQANLIDIFKSSDSLNIAEAIQYICGIDVRINPDSCLPNQICDVCLECLQASFSFRIRTQQSDKTLHNILQGSIIANEYTIEEDETEENNETESFITHVGSHSEEENNGQEFPFDIVSANETSSQCPYCQRNFTHQKNLRTHIRRHFSEGKISCTYCQKRYHTKFDLQRHMTKIHSDGFFYKCELCDKEFPSKPECNRHIRLHNEKKTFSCPVCEMEFKLKHNAQQHINFHHGKMPFFCEVCGKRFTFACKLKYHNKSKCKPSVHISVPKE